jgi:hypothetical protein
LANTLTAMARRCDNWLCDENAGYDAALDLISSLMNELDQAAGTGLYLKGAAFAADSWQGAHNTTPTHWMPLPPAPTGGRE